MSLRRYKMYSSSGSTVSAADTFAILRPGTIKQIFFNFLVDSITDGGSVRAQISRAAVSDFSVGGGSITQALAAVCAQSNFVTSGLAQVVGAILVPCNDRVTVGESLYYNQVVTGTLVFTCDVTIVIEET